MRKASRIIRRATRASKINRKDEVTYILLVITSSSQPRVDGWLLNAINLLTPLASSTHTSRLLHYGSIAFEQDFKYTFLKY